MQKRVQRADIGPQPCIGEKNRQEDHAQQVASMRGHELPETRFIGDAVPSVKAPKSRDPDEVRRQSTQEQDSVDHRGPSIPRPPALFQRAPDITSQDRPDHEQNDDDEGHDLGYHANG